ncbi:MAG: DUF4386 domain-containing protein [Sphingobacteriales bacterium]|nr:DUF4386 domain-containing protein [Sphingobacteriales bacterium]OJW01336.1 MAG: hypothetical protein BGO52_06530 [Sphingobacteriales bacterium 44-61]
MNTNKNTARAAGSIYLIVVITGMFSLAYIPQKLIDWNNSRVTFNNITTSHSLFRFGIYSSVLCYVAFTFLPLFLYKLLRTVNESHARAMVILALLSVPLSFNNLQHKYAAVTITGKESLLQNISLEDLQSKLMFSLYQYNDGLLLATVFWGLWLFPLGLLVYRSGFIPKFLGILLMLGCVGHLINYTGNTLFENYAQIGIGKYMGMLPAVAEIGTCFWLLFFGVQIKRNGK